MADRTGIEWTDETWNPIVGCSITSPGCKGCYAMGMAYRLEAMAAKPDGSGNPALNHYTGTTELTRQGKPVWTGKLGFSESALLKPLRWKKPRRIFVNSMSDLFHESVPDEWIDEVFGVMAMCPQHTFQVLTKRSERMREYVGKFSIGGHHVDTAIFSRHCALPGGGFDTSQDSTGFAERARAAVKVMRGSPGFPWHLPNVWLGVSVEDQQRADERIPDLLATPAAKRFLSCEPLLGPVDWITPIARWQDATPSAGKTHLALGRCLIDWIIAGGESGAAARPMQPGWARAVRDQCQVAGVPFFFKQWGKWSPCEVSEDEGQRYFDPPVSAGNAHNWLRWEGNTARPARADETLNSFFAPGVLAVPDGKKRGGRLLDGREWSEFPA